MNRDAAAKTNPKNSSQKEFVPFVKVFLTGKEREYLDQVLKSGNLAGNGYFTKLVHQWLESKLDTKSAFLTSAGTLALEMAALLLDLNPGDEVILPSFTFTTTASAFVRANLVPVFIDIRSDTLNLDAQQIEAAITPKTKAVVPVHYAGVACEMEQILSIAQKYKLKVVEDSAHGIYSKYNNKYLGTLAPLGVLSFHETKNIVGGEGGALLVNDPELTTKAQRIWQKGTNKIDMELGHVDSYSWIELGSSFAANEFTAAMIYAQLEQARSIVEARKVVWNRYHELLKNWEEKGVIRRPVIPNECEHNGHIYYLLTNSNRDRDNLIAHLKEHNIESVFHYIPLHNSPAGIKFGRAQGTLSNTIELSERLIRLPIWPDLNKDTQERIVSMIESFFKK